VVGVQLGDGEGDGRILLRQVFGRLVVRIEGALVRIQCQVLV
jgi:hypothetical protein